MTALTQDQKEQAVTNLKGFFQRNNITLPNLTAGDIDQNVLALSWALHERTGSNKGAVATHLVGQNTAVT